MNAQLRSIPCRLLPALLAPALAVAADPALVVTVADAPRTAAAFVAGPGRGWANAPAVQSWRLEAAVASGLGWSPVGGSVVRLVAGIGPPVAGLSQLGVSAAMQLPEGRDPAGTAAVQFERQGGWLLATLPRMDAEIPAAQPVDLPMPRMDLGLRLDLGAASAAATALAVAKAAGLDLLELAAAINAGDVEEVAALGGSVPLRAIDRAALVGIPGQTELVIAIGIDGAALAKRAAAMVQAAGLRTDVLAATLQERLGSDLEAVAAACDGTSYLALLPDGGFAASLPATAPLDAWFDGMLRSEYPGMADQVIADARAGGTSLAIMAPFPMHLRRAGQRWLVASSAEPLAEMASTEPAPFPQERFGPTPEDASVLACWNGRAIPHLLAGLLQSQGHPVLRGLGAACEAGAGSWPAGWMHAAPVDGRTLIAARNGPGLVALAAMGVSDAALPVLAGVWRQAGIEAASLRMKRFAEIAVAFAGRHDARWPGSIAELRAWAKDAIADDELDMPGRKLPTISYCYVPPAVATPDQPILLQDPACHGGRGGLVGYADGTVRYVEGAAMWNEARRLAQVAEGEHRGIARNEWRVIPKSF